MLDGCYLAYPIDQHEPGLLSLFEQIERFKIVLLNAGAVSWVFDPGDAFRVNPEAEKNDRLPRVNRAALNAADLVVAFLPAGVASVGVPMEIDRARAQGKHVIVFSDADSYMLELPHVTRFSNWENESIEDAVIAISKLEPPPNSLVYDDLRVKVEVDGCLPRRTYPDDAGLDLIVSEDTYIPLGEFRDVPCGVSLELPEWAWALVTGRSSAFRKRGLLVLPGILDAGYRGPVFAGVFAQQRAVSVLKGERIAQMIVQHNSTRRLAPIAVTDLSPSPRGSDGFGSTGA